MLSRLACWRHLGWYHLAEHSQRWKRCRQVRQRSLRRRAVKERHRRQLLRRVKERRRPHWRRHSSEILPKHPLRRRLRRMALPHHRHPMGRCSPGTRAPVLLPQLRVSCWNSSTAPRTVARQMHRADSVTCDCQLTPPAARKLRDAPPRRRPASGTRRRSLDRAHPPVWTPREPIAARARRRAGGRRRAGRCSSSRFRVVIRKLPRAARAFAPGGRCGAVYVACS